MAITSENSVLYNIKDYLALVSQKIDDHNKVVEAIPGQKPSSATFQLGAPFDKAPKVQILLDQNGKIPTAAKKRILEDLEYQLGSQDSDRDGKISEKENTFIRNFGSKDAYDSIYNLIRLCQEKGIKLSSEKSTDFTGMIIETARDGKLSVAEHDQILKFLKDNSIKISGAEDPTLPTPNNSDPRAKPKLSL